MTMMRQDESDTTTDEAEGDNAKTAANFGETPAIRALVVAAAVGVTATFLWSLAQTVLGPEAISKAKKKAFLLYRQAEGRLHKKKPPPSERARLTKNRSPRDVQD
jgi:hypothetical protein